MTFGDEQMNHDSRKPMKAFRNWDRMRHNRNSGTNNNPFIVFGEYVY